ncbi:ABC-F family ATP-binding cassette domain-containing protein [Herpetosiphon llansteffanensis]|uniref:ABC-F family ATP-binding cassette domain-containing protein n=1 Tax=Herpetosiphon llansteffanensis TaxID=2094568 RepID=UPI000D7C7725|nr:ABC-F family ATP-binding cassette domain-containing protein [Herpetosiphon llansteffanensis]
MNIINLETVSKAYGPKVLFENISLGLASGDRIGLIGVNGSGKSTLLKIAAGLEQPDTGRVTLRKDCRVGYLAQDPPMDANQTVLEYVYAAAGEGATLLSQYTLASLQLEHDPNDAKALAAVAELSERLTTLDAWDTELSARTVLSRLGITTLDAPLGTLSGGQRKRVAMARVLIEKPDLLILDEPTNHIDPTTVAWLEGYLANLQGALLMITHDRYFLDRVVTAIIELEDRQLHSYPGNYERFVAERIERERQRAKAELDHRNEVRRELAWLRQGAQARTTKQQARVDRANALINQERRQERGTLDLESTGRRLGKKLIEMHGLNKQIAGKTLLHNFEYQLTRDDRLGIIGPNGVGKSTLLNLIAGRLQPDSGELVIGETIHVAYYDQSSSDLNPNQRLIDYVSDGAELVQTGEGLRTASQMLERFLFPNSQHWDYIHSLSGGERRRLYLLRTLMRNPNVLLLDEPSNDLDVQTIAILEEYIEQFNGAVIVVSHDRAFLDNTVDHLLVFEGDGKVRHFPGDYSAYREASEREQASAKAVTKPSTQERPREEKPRKLTFKQQRELSELEKTIATLEARQNELNDALNNAGSDYQAYNRLSSELEQASQTLEQSYERWMELSELAAAS